MTRTLLAAALLAVLLGAPAGAATFEPGACPTMPQPMPALANARCGMLVVPENRAKANGRNRGATFAFVGTFDDKSIDRISGIRPDNDCVSAPSQLFSNRATRVADLFSLAGQQSLVY